jgi:hypothetical protein
MRKMWMLTLGLVGVLAQTSQTAEKAPEDYSKAMKDIRTAVQSIDTAAKAADF